MVHNEQRHIDNPKEKETEKTIQPKWKEQIAAYVKAAKIIQTKVIKL